MRVKTAHYSTASGCVLQQQQQSHTHTHTNAKPAVDRSDDSEPTFYYSKEGYSAGRRSEYATTYTASTAPEASVQPANADPASVEGNQCLQGISSAPSAGSGRQRARVHSIGGVQRQEGRLYLSHGLLPGHWVL